MPAFVFGETLTMWYLYFLYGGIFGVLVIGGVVLALFFLCGAVGLDGLFSAGSPRGKLTCWHCGQETLAGVKRCNYCKKELQ